MKKVIQSLILSLFVAIAAPMQRSEAAVAIATLSVPALIVSYAFLIPGMAPLTSWKQNPDSRISVLFSGLLLLDSPTTPVTFGELTAETETKLKIKSEDRVVYNSELDEARAVGQNVAQDLLKTYGSEKNVDLKKVASSAEQKWKKVCDQGQLSAGTCRVISAIRSQEIK